VGGTMPTHVFLDCEGRPYERAMIWQDGRATKEAAWLRENVGDEAMASFLGLHLPISAMMPPARILWLRHHQPELLDPSRYTMMQIKDYINFKLTSVRATDITSCLGLVNIRTHEFVAEYLRTVGLARASIPPIAEPYEVVGYVTAEAAAATGLPEGVPVVAGWIDAWCNMLGTGLGQSGMAFDVTGTSEILGITSDSAVEETQGLLNIPLTEQLRVVYALTNAGGDSLKWFVESFIDPTTKEEAFKIMEREAATIKPGADGLVFLPYLYGERSPVWDELARGTFVGITRMHHRPHFARAIYEGVAFCVRQLLTMASEVGKVNFSSVRVSGGGAHSQLLNQIKADVLGKPIEVLLVHDTGALGAAMLAAIGIGLYQDYAAAVDAMVHVDRRYTPTPIVHERYEHAYEIYLSLYPQLRDVFHGLSVAYGVFSES
jgi:xylulokinase